MLSFIAELYELTLELPICNGYLNIAGIDSSNFNSVMNRKYKIRNKKIVRSIFMIGFGNSSVKE